jgi:hypothetical protein
LTGITLTAAENPTLFCYPTPPLLVKGSQKSIIKRIQNISGKKNNSKLTQPAWSQI